MSMFTGCARSYKQQEDCKAQLGGMGAISLSAALF